MFLPPVAAVTAGLTCLGIAFSAADLFVDPVSDTQVLARKGDEIWQVECLCKDANNVIYIEYFVLVDPFRTCGETDQDRPGTTGARTVRNRGIAMPRGSRTNEVGSSRDSRGEQEGARQPDFLNSAIDAVEARFKKPGLGPEATWIIHETREEVEP